LLKFCPAAAAVSSSSLFLSLSPIHRSAGGESSLHGAAVWPKAAWGAEEEEEKKEEEEFLSPRYDRRSRLNKKKHRLFYRPETLFLQNLPALRPSIRPSVRSHLVYILARVYIIPVASRP
jgi:hypothetical protein